MRLSILPFTFFTAAALAVGFVGGVLVERASTETETEPTAVDVTVPTTTTAVEEAAPLPSTTSTTVEVFLATIFVDPASSNTSGGRSPESPINTVEAALEVAQPGDTIYLAPGTYPPIKIQDQDGLTLAPWPDREGEVVVSDQSYERTAAVLIERSDNLVIDDLRLEKSLWGVMVRSSSRVEILNLTISDIGQEGVHIKDNSSEVVIFGNTISETGKRPGGSGEFGYARFGEGVYVGTGGEDSSADRTNGVTIEGNEIFATTAEAIDIKPFTRRISIHRNLIHDIATNTSGVVVVGVGPDAYPNPEVTITGNVIWNVSTTSRFTDGNAIRLSASATVAGNVIFDVEHHAVLADGDFVGEDNATVVITNNAVARTDEPAFEVWEAPNPASVSLEFNSEDGVEALLNPLGLNGLPTEEVLILRDQLLERLAETTTS